VRIGQVLGNLLNNAVEFTEQGRISVSAAVEDLPDGKTQMRMVVTDTGVGFAPAMAEKIFERFEQADISTLRPVRRAGARPVAIVEASCRTDEWQGDGAFAGRFGLDLRGHRADLARPDRSAWPLRPSRWKTSMLRPISTT